MQISYKQYTEDLKILAIKARRFGYANNQLPEDDASQAHTEFNEFATEFAGKYSMPVNEALSIGIHIAEICILGLAY